MATPRLLVLIDDIATVLDDVAIMTKMAAKKTAGVLGDDLALNAEQVSGVRADRELPVVWAVSLGSLKKIGYRRRSSGSSTLMRRPSLTSSHSP